MNNPKLDQARKLLIMALHPNCETYEEALREELSVDGCRLKIWYSSWEDYQLWETEGSPTRNTYDEISYEIYNKDFCFEQRTYAQLMEDQAVIQGLPLTIGRVMQAIGTLFMPLIKCNVTNNTQNTYFGNGLEMQWKLVKEDGFTEATLDDQTEEAWDAIISLFS